VILEAAYRSSCDANFVEVSKEVETSYVMRCTTRPTPRTQLDITRAGFGGHIINSSDHRCRELLVLNLLQARCNVLAFHYKMGSKSTASEEPIVAPGESKKPKTENITQYDPLEA
jgi:hypothetical protein